MKALKIFTYANCGSCRKATKWLRERSLDFVEIPIREQAPSREELARMLEIYGGQIKRLFNTSGADYRSLGLGPKLATMPDEEILALLASNGNLVKRPFLLTEKGGLVGFKEEEWESFFG